MKTAVYALIFEGEQVYIGCTKSPLRRLQTHRARRPEGNRIEMVILSWHKDRGAALTREYNLIKKTSPPWNGTYSEEKRKQRAAKKYAKDFAEWQELAAKNKAVWDAACEEIAASKQQS